MVKDSLYRLNPRLCVLFTSSRTEGRLVVRRSNSMLPFSNCRLSRCGRAKTLRVCAASLTLGASARYSAIFSRRDIVNSLNTDLENSIRAVIASRNLHSSISSMAFILARRSAFSNSSRSIRVFEVLLRLR